MITKCNENTIEVTFGYGSTYVGQLTSEFGVSIVLQGVKDGPLGAARDVGRPPPPGWGPDGELDWRDGIQRVVISFANKEGGEQLLESVRHALTYFDEQIDVPITRKT
jgi:hypothetical protein